MSITELLPLLLLFFIALCGEATASANAENHLGDIGQRPSSYLFKKLPIHTVDPIGDMPGEPLSPADFKNAANLKGLEPPFEDQDMVDGINRFNEMDGLLFEGDIVGVHPRDDETATRRQKGTKLNNAAVDVNLLWESATVPYVISALFGTHERSVIAKAILEFHNKTCLRFVPRSNGQNDYVKFIYGTGCYSNVGRQRGAQDVSLGLGCLKPGIVMHELMHAVGFWHEQSRTDRDDYINIHWNNIKEGMESNFEKYSTDRIQGLATSYDLGSIMHYEGNAFAKDPNYPTITPKKMMSNKQMGQRDGFSDVDVLKLNRLYRCQSAASQTVTVVVPEVASTATKLPASEKGKCVDEHKYCKIWSQMQECSKNPWMTVHCRQSCNLCEEECGNYKSDCYRWAQEGECQKNSEYMKSYCRASCGYCGESRIDCVDDNRYCRVWATNGDCQTNARFMRLHCKQSCGEC